MTIQRPTHLDYMPVPRPDERSAIPAYTPAVVRPLHLLRAACGSRHGGVGS